MRLVLSHFTAKEMEAQKKVKKYLRSKSREVGFPQCTIKNALQPSQGAHPGAGSRRLGEWREQGRGSERRGLLSYMTECPGGQREPQRTRAGPVRAGQTGPSPSPSRPTPSPSLRPLQTLDGAVGTPVGQLQAVMDPEGKEASQTSLPCILTSPPAPLLPITHPVLSPSPSPTFPKSSLVSNYSLTPPPSPSNLSEPKHSFLPCKDLFSLFFILLR